MRRVFGAIGHDSDGQLGVEEAPGRLQGVRWRVHPGALWVGTEGVGARLNLQLECRTASMLWQ